MARHDPDAATLKTSRLFLRRLLYYQFNVSSDCQFVDVYGPGRNPSYICEKMQLLQNDYLRWLGSLDTTRLNRFIDAVYTRYPEDPPEGEE